MAVVALYFVDFLKGNVEMAFWTLPPLHFFSLHFPCDFSSLVTLQRIRLAPSLISHISPSLAAGGGLNRSAAERARLQKEAASQEE